MSLTVTIKSATRAQIAELRGICGEFPGRHQVVIQVVDPHEDFDPIKTDVKVDASDHLVRAIKANFGKGKCEVTTTRKGK